MYIISTTKIQNNYELFSYLFQAIFNNLIFTLFF